MVMPSVVIVTRSTVGAGTTGVTVSSNRSHSNYIIPSGLVNEETQQKDAFLFVANISKYWEPNDIKQFVFETCKSPVIEQTLKHVTVLRDLEDNSKGECLLTFANPNACHMAMKLLRGAECDNKKIIVMQDSGRIPLYVALNPYLASDKSNLVEHYKNLRNNTDPNTVTTKPTNNVTKSTNTSFGSSNETYGLSKEFLDYLEIKLPLHKIIFIGNLESSVTEEQIRELFQHAGHIYGIMLMKSEKAKTFAKIEYDHPVEAVQAISMFHGHMYMNRTLIVKMDNNGSLQLKRSGPGLGPNGQPLRAVRYSVELEPLKQLLLQEIAKLQTIKPQEGNVNTGYQGILQNNSIGAMSNFQNTQNLNGLLNVDAFNPYNQYLYTYNMMNSQGVQNLVMTPGLQPQSNVMSVFQNQNIANTVQNPMAGIQNQFSNIDQNIIGNKAHNKTDEVNTFLKRKQSKESHRQESSPTQSDSYEKYLYDKMYSSDLEEPETKYTRRVSPTRSEHSDSSVDTSSDLLIFTNLPSSLNADTLSSKMSEIGDLKFVELTGGNKAIVKFNNTRDAERCIRLLDRSKVDGQRINVKYL
ncbi:uncharacterized protein LOC131855051 [Achroia grisella]|uniref:uncharacterized protein LOC131855051 n=1 Tax=Achroia grisella TaxID=688607 RepID=UPI0027D3036B|nr:uncharacterized protein LOC131855051 [Achroia grisella]